MKWHHNVFCKAGVLFALFLLSLPALAQTELSYQMNVGVSPQTQTFTVKGTLDFFTDATTQDSLIVILNQGKGTPVLSLVGTASELTTREGSNATLTYHFRFVNRLSPGTRLELRYAYERGAAPSFQYYLDSTYCMAGGYGTPWYPQLMSHSQNGEANYCRGKGTLTVITETPFLPVMACATRQVTSSPATTTTVFRYAQPDIFSLYVGAYTRHTYRGPIPFSTYALSKDIDAAGLSRHCSEVLDYLSHLFGPLTIPNFSIIELPQAIAERTNLGGASLLGGVLMPTDALRRFNYALFGHEISHQWWGNQIRIAGEKGSALLSEGLAQYGSLQVVEHFDPTHALTYRKKGYPGYIYDQSGLGYLKNIAANNDAPLTSLQGINSHLIADSKGFMALNLLSEIMGKASFHKALLQIQEQYKVQGLTWAGFLEKLDKVHGSSLNWFDQQWFERTGAPAWTAGWKANGGKVTVTLTQKDSLYRLPLTILVRYGDGTTAAHKIWLQQKTEVFHLPALHPVEAVAVDPYYEVLHWSEDLTPIAYTLSKAQKVLMLIYEQQLEEAENLALTLLGENTGPDPYGLQFTLWTYLGRIKSLQNKTAEALEAYQKAVQCPTRPPELLARAYYKIAVLAASTGDQALLHQAASDAVKADNRNGGIEGMASKVKPLL